ncbi:MAG: SOS response-associated peptidase [Pseudolabrys sp.]|nr:SOS response-associated peptidase [Pseudolabrys sp.]
MCGRYAVTLAPEVFRQMFGYPEQPNFPPRYNIAPTQPIAIVRMKEGRREFALVRWGLLPSWVKDPKDFALVINARGESVLDKPAFRAAMNRRRCLIPADGFYEWKAAGKGKQPHFIRRKDGAPFAFAGLWECWTGPNGEELETAAIVTTSANRDLAPIHERMPVVVPADAFALWLDPNVDEKTAASLIAPAQNDLFEAYPVSTAVNRVANDNAELVARFDGPPAPAPRQAAPKKAAAAPATRKPPKDDGQASLF